MAKRNIRHRKLNAKKKLRGCKVVTGIATLSIPRTMVRVAETFRKTVVIDYEKYIRHGY